MDNVIRIRLVEAALDGIKNHIDISDGELRKHTAYLEEIKKQMMAHQEMKYTFENIEAKLEKISKLLSRLTRLEF